MLVEDLDAPWKQKHTARRVWDRLIDEHDATVSYSTVRDYVREWRVQINADAGRVVREVFVPQEHAPGVTALTEVPHFCSSKFLTLGRSAA